MTHYPSWQSFGVFGHCLGQPAPDSEHSMAALSTVVIVPTMVRVPLTCNTGLARAHRTASRPDISGPTGPEAQGIAAIASPASASVVVETTNRMSPLPQA